ncbi:endothelin-converting enzyme homolog [Venturia canescens]|uniref:endothelin-converting enzyme homolog n=1 Tax=Venturia canescens TaxID=32260 RepID=UPI001C9C1D0C|nr:endothelin-converting enzyme homolog [Venturia canescens]
MDTWLSLEAARCPQFDTVSGTLNMSEERKDDETTPSVYTIGSERNLVPVRSRAAYFKKRKKGSLVVVLLAFIMASLIACIVVLAVLYSRSNRVQELCDNEHCVRIAASLKESMDTSIDPCDDFYGYVCGRWSEEHLSSVPDNSWFSERTDRVTWRIRNLLRKNLTEGKVPWAVGQAKKLFESCIDTESLDSLGLLPLFQTLKDLDLPATPAAMSGKRGNVVQQMARVRKVMKKDVFVGFDVGPDPRNKSRNIIYLDMPSSSSPLPSYNTEVEKKVKHMRSRFENLEATSEDDSSEDTSAEKLYMAKVIREIVTNGTTSNCSLKNEASDFWNEEIKNVADAIYELSGVFYFMSRSNENDTVADENVKDENYFLVDTLQELTDQYVKEMNSSLVPRKLWRPYIEELFKDVEEIDFDKELVLVWNIEYLKDLAYLLDETDETVLETAIWWIVVDMIVPHSSKNLRLLWEEYVMELVEGEYSEPRSLYCAGLVNEMMAMAVSWLFVERDFHENQGVRVVEMLEDIRSAFASLVTRADWMDHATKLATLEKSRKMTYVIGHPDWLFDDETINEYYEGIDMKEDNYLANMLMIVRLMSEAELEYLQEINYLNETFWGAEPTDVNAVHTFIVNHITVPAGILQFPFYELGLEALNYGAIGTILGHELTHGFDNSGRLYDEDGNLRQWWSNTTIRQYNSKIECFVKHYGNYYIDEVNDYIDGKLTLDENIADNGGLREAVLAYKKWQDKHGQEPMLPGFTHLTHEQLLFLGYAHLWCEVNTPDSLRWKLQDTHCPGYVRLRGVLRNSQEFSKAWNCPLGSRMNPEKKCQVW